MKQTFTIVSLLLCLTIGFCANTKSRKRKWPDNAVPLRTIARPQYPALGDRPVLQPLANALRGIQAKCERQSGAIIKASNAGWSGKSKSHGNGKALDFVADTRVTVNKRYCVKRRKSRCVKYAVKRMTVLSRTHPRSRLAFQCLLRSAHQRNLVTINETGMVLKNSKNQPVRPIRYPWTTGRNLHVGLP